MGEFTPEVLALFDEEASNADSRSVKAQYGKVSIKPRFVDWRSGSPVECDLATYKTIPPKQSGLELVVEVNIREFAPHLDWDYTRRVRVGDADWHNTFKSSIENIMGKGTMSKGNYGTTVASLQGKYVEIHDMPQKKNPDFNVPKLVRVFATAEECGAAHKERFGDAPAGGGFAKPSAGVVEARTGGSAPEGYSVEAWAETIPYIKEELRKGTSPQQLANDYTVPVPTIVELKNSL